MAGEETEGTPNPTAVDSGEESEVAAAARSLIVGSDGPMFDPDDETEPGADVAPDAGHLTEALRGEQTEAPASGTPTDDTGTPGTETNADGKPAEGAEPEDGEKPEGEVDDHDAELLGLLGVSETEPDDSPVWKERHSEATRALHEARDELKQVQECLRQSGREIIVTRDGPKIIVTDDAKDFSPDEIDLPSVIKTLSQDDLDRIAENPAEGAQKLAKLISKEFASRVPPITARPQDALLTERQLGEAWQELVDRKLPGSDKPVYPGLEKPEVTAIVEQVWEHLPTEWVDLAERNIQAAKMCQELSALRAWRYLATKKAVADAKKRKVAEQNEKNQKGVAVQGSGSETAPKGQSEAATGGEESFGERLRRQIVSADDAPISFE